MNCKVLVPLPVTFRQRTPERVCNLIYSVNWNTERTVDVCRVIFSATGVIEFKIEGQIRFNAQMEDA